MRLVFTLVGIQISAWALISDRVNVLVFRELQMVLITTSPCSITVSSEVSSENNNYEVNRKLEPTGAVSLGGRQCTILARHPALCADLTRSAR
jgi:hypothetical protein